MMMQRLVPSILRLRTIQSAARIEGLVQCHIHPLNPQISHRGAFFFRGLSTTNEVKADAVPNPGEVVYQQYLTALQEWNQLQQEQERNKSEKLFAAWQKSQEKEHVSDKAGGVAVVKTLAKETKAASSKMPPEQEKAHLLLQRAALEHQHPLALIQYANSQLSSFRSHATRHSVDCAVVPVGTALDTVEDCLRYYRMAGDAGCAAGYYNLAHFLWDGVDGLVPARRDEARQLFYQAIQLGDADAMFFCGVLRLGQEADKSRPDQLQKALQWMEQAGAQGHPGALHYLAVFYLNGYPPLQIAPCSDEEFQQRLTRAVEFDDCGDAYYLRGSCHYSGASGYPQDLKLSFDDFFAASELGHAEACVNAGVMLHKGVGSVIPSDPARAFQLYQRGGELGCREGWRNVVACYAQGKGVPQNLEMARYIAETMLKDDDGEDQDENDGADETSDAAVETK